MLYLSVDLGDRRSGLAVGDDATGVITPAGVLELPRGPELLEAIARAVEEHGPDAIVIGLPLNMDGTEGPRAKVAREMGEQLAGMIDLPIHYQDERLTSYAAEQQLAGTGRTHKQKKKARDALAAVAILEDFLRGASAEESRK